jgi:sulfur carrier protein
VRVLINGRGVDLSARSTLADAVTAMHVELEGRGVAAAVDGEVVPRAEWARTELTDGARVELVVAVQGG